MYEVTLSYSFDELANLLLSHSTVVDRKFNRVENPARMLLAAIEFTLGEISGESGRRAVLFYLAQMSGVIPPDDFTNLVYEEPEIYKRKLNELFGPPAAKICRRTVETLAALVSSGFASGEKQDGRYV